MVSVVVVELEATACTCVLMWSAAAVPLPLPLLLVLLTTAASGHEGHLCSCGKVQVAELDWTVPAHYEVGGGRGGGALGSVGVLQGGDKRQAWRSKPSVHYAWTHGHPHYRRRVDVAAAAAAAAAAATYAEVVPTSI